MNSDFQQASHRAKIPFLASAFIGCLLLALFLANGAPSVAHAQQPTGSVPTVTGTAAGPFITVDPSIPLARVYAGPSSFDYPAVGIMQAGETSPALGRAQGRDDWIMIYYAGVPDSTAWIFALYVSLSPGALLPVIEIPSTPTPFSTPTIDPTLEAAFIGQQTPTRLPTFTPPPPLDVPSFDSSTTSESPSVPAGLIILVLGLFGFFGAALSYLRGR